MEDCQSPFIGWRRSTPIFHRKEGRSFYLLVKPDGTRTTTSVARYKLQVSIGRLLRKDEQVDHIDNDKTNDSLDNLQILSIATNNKKQRKHAGLTRKMVRFTCQECGKTSSRRYTVCHFITGKTKTIGCSRECGGKLSVLTARGESPKYAANIQIFTVDSL